MSNSDESAAGCVVLLIFCVIMAILGAWLWPYTINTWLVFFGKPPSIVWWQGALLGLVPWFNYSTVPAAVITWLLMLFLI